ncbi:MAG: PD-(D/E)XK nuclease family protein [Candidatus Berkelbacteria bacterium]
MRISYSAFQTFNQCPLKYKFQYIDWVKVPEKPEFFFGGLVHEVVQMALRRDPIIPKIEDLIKFYESKWREDVFPDKLTSDQYLELGREMIKNFHEGYKPGLRKVVAAEKRFQIPLENHTLSGVIDRVDKLPFGAYEIVDYKTSKSLPSQEEVDEDKQLATYAIAVQTLWPEAKDMRLTLHFLKHNSMLTTARTQEQIEKMKLEIVETADKITKTKTFKPCENKFCDWCDYKHLCPLKKDQVSTLNNQVKEIDAIVNDYIYSYNKIAELTPKIQAHFDAEKLKELKTSAGTITRDDARNLWVE